jgi:hypothetical protein
MACTEAKKIENAKGGDVDLGPTMEDAEAELLAHFGTLDTTHDAVQSRMQNTIGETAVEKKERYVDEKKVRKQNKKLGHSEMLVACSQNFNGNSSREKIEEAARVMSDKKIGIVFGQEGSRPANSVERFDTGHLFIVHSLRRTGVSISFQHEKRRELLHTGRNVEECIYEGRKGTKEVLSTTSYPADSPPKQQNSLPC